MPSALRSLVVFGLLSAVVVLSAPGCSQQALGERCDRAANSDEDCDVGLICVAKSELRGQVSDRCCYPDAANPGDVRCARATATTPDDSAGGAAGASAEVTAGTGGTSTESSGGAGGASSQAAAGTTNAAAGTTGMTAGGSSSMTAGGTASMTSAGMAGVGTASDPNGGKGGA